MASFYSKPAAYGNYTQPINLELVNFVLSSKQQKYDYNLAKLDDKITNQLGAIDLARTEDKEYFLNKAEQTINSMGNLAKLDFSQSGVTRQMDASLDSIIDDRVLNDVISTKNYRSFQSTLQDKQKNDKEAYSTLNAAFAMETQGANSWLNGESDSLGTINYEDFTDVGALLNDIAENLEDHARVTKTYTANGYYFESYEGEILTSSEVKSIAQQLLPAKAKRQMEINGWGKYDGGTKDVNSISTAFGQFKDSQFKGIDADIARNEANAIKMEGVDSKQAKALANQADSLKEYKTRLSTKYGEWMGAPDKFRNSMTGTMETESTLDAFGNTFQINNVSTELKPNSVAIHMDNMRMKEAELQMKAATLTAKNSGGLTQLSGVYDKDGEIDMLGETRTLAEGYKTEASGMINAAMHNLPQAIQDDINNSFNPKLGISKEDHIYNELMKNKENNMIPLPQLAAIDNAVEKWHSTARSYKEAMDKGIEDQEADNMGMVVKNFKENPFIEMVDEKGATVAVGDYIGNLTAEQLNSPEYKQKKDQMLKAYYADKIETRGFWGGLLEKFNNWRIRQGEDVLANNPDFYDLGGGREKNIERLEDLKNKKYNDNEEAIIMTGRLAELSGSDEEAKKYLEQVKKAKTYDSNSRTDLARNVILPTIGQVFDWDDSVTEDTNLNSWITVDGIKRGAKSYLSDNPERMITHPTLVRASSPEGLDLADVIQSIHGSTNPILLSIQKGHSMTMRSINKDEIEVTGVTLVKGVETIKATTLFKKDLPQSILNQIDFNNEKDLYAGDKMKPVESNVIFYESGNLDKEQGVADLVGTNTGYARSIISKDIVMNDIMEKYPQILGTVAQPTPAAAAIELMLNSKDVQARIAKVQGRFFKQILLKDKNRTSVIHSDYDPIDPSNYSNATKNMKFLPQMYVTNILKEMLEEYADKPNTPPPFIKKLTEHYGARQN